MSENGASTLEAQIQRASVKALIDKTYIEAGRDQRVTSESLEANAKMQAKLRQQLDDIQAEFQNRIAPIQAKLQAKAQEAKSINDAFTQRESARRGLLDGLEKVVGG